MTSCLAFTKAKEKCKRKGTYKGYCKTHLKAYQKDFTISKWKRSIWDTPEYNPHGTFKKEDCEIEIYLYTSCGFIFLMQGGCKKCKTCQKCSAVHKKANLSDEDGDDNFLKDYLVVLYNDDYKFIGWPRMEKDFREKYSNGNKMSLLSDKDDDRLRKLVESGKDLLFPYE